jgi:hypothetical protein
MDGVAADAPTEDRLTAGAQLIALSRRPITKALPPIGKSTKQACARRCGGRFGRFIERDTLSHQRMHLAQRKATGPAQLVWIIGKWGLWHGFEALFPTGNARTHRPAW